MTDIIENLTNPGIAPTDGDDVRVTRTDGISVQYQYQALVAPVEEPITDTKLSRGEFRLLFTFAERTAEVLFARSAEQLVDAGAPVPVDPNNLTMDELAAINSFNTAATFLTMNADFADAEFINLADAAVSAALDFMIAFGIIAAYRKAEILLGTAPA